MSRALHATSFALALAVATAAPSAAEAGAAEIEGVEFPERIEWSGTPLTLSGLGLLRYRIFFKGYVAALYLGEGVAPEEALRDVPRRLEIEYFWPIPARKFVEATEAGIARNTAGEIPARVRGAVERMNALYRDVEPGDRYSLTYVPGLGTEPALNGEALGSVAGAEFSSALFAIWLGEQALDAALREQLLARR